MFLEQSMWDLQGKRGTETGLSPVTSVLSIPAPQMFHINKQAYVMRRMDNGAIRLCGYADTNT
jgi:hypothetical protein